MTVHFRPIEDTEQPLALELWSTVFGRDDGYFARYYAADPWHEPGDSLGAWVDGTLASVVHLCRRPLNWNGRSLLCGGIANVATLPAYRRQGLSRHLLSLAIERMEAIGCAFSTLGTGVPDFYAVLGWELIDVPRFQITPSSPPVRPAVEDDLAPARPAPKLAALYDAAPRPLQQERPPFYFDGWVGWSWASHAARAAVLPAGYAVLTSPNLDSPEPEDPLPFVSEWRASDASAEKRLLETALAQSRKHQLDRVIFAGLPQHVRLSELEPLGRVEPLRSSGQMIRRVGLPEREFARVQDAYASGSAASWSADGF